LPDLVGGDPVLAPAKIDEFDSKVFSIGPFGVRVGFTFQQERALNLVHALARDGFITPASRILIAGGGLAGLTAKLALHGMGFGDIWLFEARDDIVKSQHAAMHRMLHPCYNSWPLANHFSPTSNLPFLNWYATSAAEVVSFLRTRWTDLYSKKLSDVRPGYVLTKLELTPGGDAPVQRVLAHVMKKSDESIDKIEFDLAILATGFGTEKDLEYSAVADYWTPDKIDKLREDEDEKRKIFVSGIGDGGLMDFARLSFKNVEESDLAVETISRLRHTKYDLPRRLLGDDRFERSPVEIRIREVEISALKLLPLNAEAKADFGTSLENRIARILRDGYKSVIDMLPREAREFLDGRVHSKLISGQLRLIGKLEAPFTCATASINKILIAYLLSRQPNFYQQGYFDTKTTELVTPSGRSSLASDIVILRHGGQPPAYEIASNFKEQNRSLNRALADLANVKCPDYGVYTNLREFVSTSTTSSESVNYRGRLAQAFASIKRVNISLSQRVVRGHSPAFWFEFDPTCIANRTQLRGRLGGFPHEIFGVALMAKDPQDADCALGGTER
jgi:hypothetical protein